MHRILFPVFLAGTALTVPAVASTVNVDFDEGANVAVRSALILPGSPSGYARSVTAGVWQENGINAHWQMYSDLLTDYGIEPDQITPDLFCNLSDQDPGADPFVTETMRIERSDGGRFNLSRIGTGTTYEGYAAYGQLNPEVGSAISDTVAALLPLLGPSLELVGIKADGTQVTGTGTTKTAANWRGDDDLYSYPALFDGIDVVFDPDTLAAFTDLTSLTLRVFPGYWPDLLAEQLAALETFAELGAPPELVQGLEECGLSSCHVDGLGEFTFFTDIAGGRNDIRNVWIRDFDIEMVGGPGPQPAPVPLPASALLLLGSLAALVAARARRTF